MEVTTSLNSPGVVSPCLTCGLNWHMHVAPLVMSLYPPDPSARFGKFQFISPLNYVSACSPSFRAPARWA